MDFFKKSVIPAPGRARRLGKLLKKPFPKLFNAPKFLNNPHNLLTLRRKLVTIIS